MFSLIALKLKNKLDLENRVLKKVLGKIVVRLTIIFIIIVVFSLGILSFFNSEKFSTPNKSISYKSIETKFEISEWSHWLIYYDEVLTQSARNYAYTKELKWKVRYDSTLKDLYKLIKLILAKSSDKELQIFKKFDQVNSELAILEAKSFDAIVKNDQTKAIAILDSKRYESYKIKYQGLIKKYLEVKTLIYRSSFNNYIDRNSYIIKLNKRRSELISYVFLLVVILLVVFTFLLIWFIIKRIKKISLFVDQIIIGDDFSDFESRNSNDLDEYVSSVIETLKNTRLANDRQFSQEMSIQLETLRNEFKRNLHDRLGVLVSATKLHFYFLKPVDQEIELIKHYNTCLKLLDQTFNEIKQLSTTKSDDFLESNLIDKINALISFFKTLKDIEILIDYNIDEVLLSNNQKEAIELVIREGINNAISHSKASMIKIHLYHEKQNIHMDIKDNGVGFDLEMVQRKNGILHMQERINQLDGKIEIHSNVGNGTLIKVKF